MSLCTSLYVVGLLLGVCAFVMLSLRLYGHRLSIQSVRAHPSTFSVSVYGIKYTRSPSLCFFSPHLHFSLHFPRPSAPTLFTLTLYAYSYADSAHQVSLSRLRACLSLFPRAPAGPFLDVTLDGFRVRVFSSDATPLWLQNLRENLVYTVLNGDTLRLDDISTKLIICTTTPAPLGSTASADSEESILTATASQWHIRSLQARPRLYKFGAVDAQLRHAWDPDAPDGAFVLVAEDCNWVSPPESPQTKDKPSKPTSLLSFLLAPAHIFLFLLFRIPTLFLRIPALLHDPASALDLHVPRLDVTFDCFRLRDAELVRQGVGWVRREYVDVREAEGWGSLGETVFGVLGNLIS